MFKKPLIIKLMVLIFIVSLLASCGGGGGGGGTPGGGTGDTMTITIGAGTPATYNEGAYDPLLIGTVSGTKTYIDLCSGVLIGGACTTAVNIVVNGTTTLSYPVGATTKVSYTDGSTLYQTSTTGAVNLAADVGAVGSSIQGTFDVTLSCVLSCTAKPATITMIGSFNVTREQ